LIAGLCDRCAEKQKIVMAIKEILRALVHFNWTTTPADMPVGFWKDRCSPRLLLASLAKIILRFVIANTSRVFEGH